MREGSVPYYASKKRAKSWDVETREPRAPRAPIILTTYSPTSIILVFGAYLLPSVLRLHLGQPVLERDPATPKTEEPPKREHYIAIGTNPGLLKRRFRVGPRGGSHQGWAFRGAEKAGRMAGGIRGPVVAYKTNVMSPIGLRPRGP